MPPAIQTPMRKMNNQRIDWPSAVICVGPDWYSASRVSAMHLVDGLYERGATVLWVNPVPVRFPGVSRPDFWKKVQAKAKTHSRLLAQVRANFHVYSPLYVPVFSRGGMLVNRHLVSSQVAALRRLLHLESPLVLGAGFAAWYALDALRELPFVFHFADKISAFREVSTVPAQRRILEQMESDLIRASTLATCSSRSIYQYIRSRAGLDAGKVLYLPHGVNMRLFAQGTRHSCPEDMRKIRHPIAGYFGSLTQTNDKSTFEYAARCLTGWSFVFIGDVRGDYGSLASLPNVHFLGRKPYPQIPAYGSQFDVSFMGWLPHEWISNSFPVKTLEYLALGKPVVCSSEIPELEERFPGLVRITSSPDEFTAALQQEHANNTDERAAERQQRVSSESWEQRVDTILSILLQQGKNR